MDTLISTLSAITALIFLIIAGVTLASYSTPRARFAARWLSLSFSIIAVISLLGIVLPNAQFEHMSWFDWAEKLEVALLALFPYALYRFASFFRRQSHKLEKLYAISTSSVVAATFLLPYFPGENESIPWWFSLYGIVFVAHWAAVSLSAAWMLWRDGKNRAGVVHNRMNLLASAAIAMTLALFTAGFAGDSPVQIASQLLAILSGVLFFIGYFPPSGLKVLWRKNDQEALSKAISGLMAATSEQEVIDNLLPPIVRVIGGSSAIMYNQEGVVKHNYLSTNESAGQIGQYLRDTKNTLSASGELNNGTALYHRHSTGWIVVFTGRATPFLGDEEFRLIKSILTLTDLALARVVLFEKERQAVARLENLDQLKTEFVAMVAHDLRSPMAVIAGFADVLKTQRDTLSEAQQDEFLEMISDTTRRLSFLIEDILQVAKIESGEFKYEYQSFDLVKIARQVAFEQETTHPGRVIEVKLSSMPNVYGDPHRVTQVINNLVGNALKFSPPDTRIAIDITSKDGYCCFTVKDQGMGIAKEDLERLFTKFSRINPPDGSPKTPGTGLGLFISKSMIEAQNGSMWVESVPCKGSTFGFKLPLTKTVNKQDSKVNI